MRTLLTLFGMSLTCLLAGCGPKPLSTGPYSAFLGLERWHRSAPANEYTMTGLVTFHQDDRTPRGVDIDANCGVAYGNWAESAFRRPTFGKITMKIADRREVTWKDDPEGVGIDFPSGELVWDSGDTLSVSAAGGELPGFDLTATVPPQIVLTSHDLAAQKENQLHISRSAPLELRWDATQGDVVLLFMQFSWPDSSRRQRLLWCGYPAGTGSISVPTSVMEHLLPSSFSLATNIYFGGLASQRVALDGVDVKVFTVKNEVARVQIDN